MKSVAITLSAFLFGGAALAETTTIRRTETPLGDSTTITRRDDDVVTRRSVTETTGSLGCETKSVTKENDDGDRVTKTRTNC